MDDCPVCGGPLDVMGRLGNLAHLLCRDCGVWASRPAQADDPEPDTAEEPDCAA
jgi:hypothetical protein